jgi:hypothetical protein
VKLYKINGAPAFLNANEVEVAAPVAGPVEGPVSTHGRPPDELEAAELRAVAAAAGPTTLPSHGQRDWEASDIEDFILNRASVAQVSNIFECLGTRFKEHVNGA